MSALPEIHRVLVTGATGTIGTATVAALVDAGIAVTSLSVDREAPLADRNVVADVRDLDALAEALADVDAVVHLAAIISPDRGAPAEVFGVNTQATFNVLTEAAQRGVGRAVIASSINAVGTIFNPYVDSLPYLPLDERAPSDVADWYSLSKQCDELTARMVWRRWGMTVVGLRFPRTQPGPDLRAGAAELAADPEIGVNEAWSYLDVEDAADAVVAALTRSIEPGAYAVLLAAADTLLTIPTEEALERFAPDVPRRRPMPGHSSTIDTTAARELFGFTPRRSVHDADRGDRDD